MAVITRGCIWAIRSTPDGTGVASLISVTRLRWTTISPSSLYDDSRQRCAGALAEVFPNFKSRTRTPIWEVLHIKKMEENYMENISPRFRASVRPSMLRSGFAVI
jgi:hypothetical protein